MPHYTILIVDDDAEDIEILKRRLGAIQGWDITLIEASTPDTGMAALKKQQPDLIFIDYQLGCETGLDLFHDMLHLGLTSPVIMITGHGNEQVAVEAMKAGIADYIVKEMLTPEGLCRTITNALDKFAMQRKIEEQQQELEKLARIDDLTGLYNRRYFMERLAQEAETATRYDRPYSIMMLDLDHFKRVNDSYGHPLGDEVLATTAQTIKEQIRNTDIAGRLGGEEFCILASNISLGSAWYLANRICKAIASNQYTADEGQKFQITCSIGLSRSLPESSDYGTVLKFADKSLYEAKAKGRNQVVCSDCPNGSCKNNYQI